VHLLILGHSSIVGRRVLPAARACGAFDRISVASRHHAAAEFNDYDEALVKSGADVVYVSGVNAAHEEWAARALERDFHVVVDKPAFANAEAAERMAALARRRGKALAEATVFAFHPQMRAVCSLVQPGDAPRVAMTFSIPPLPAGDFRYRAASGGGSLNDIGPYVVAANRLLLGKAPDTVACVASGGPAAEVDTSFAALLGHTDGGAITAHCGFDTVYQNRLSVITRTRAIDAERIFSTPPDFSPQLKTVEADTPRTLVVPAADSFALFFSAFSDAIHAGNVSAFESALLEDARLLERLRHATGRM
jgi:dTDP-3,4-didehydro-2,6-dideoxy-alpha-D-glucose 3-reductase